MGNMLEVNDLSVSIEGKKVLDSVRLAVKAGEVHALLGRNGSGKSSLALTLMGHPKYTITSGEILFEGVSINGWSATERARAGIFLSFQNPPALPGVVTGQLLRASLRATQAGVPSSARQARERIRAEAKDLGIAESFLGRSFNDGFSGGERKRMEALQYRLLKPKLSVFDETDSGLDRDAVRLVCDRIRETRSPERAIIVITHYHRMLEALEPTHVHFLQDGTIERSGDMSLARTIDLSGFSAVTDVR